MAGEFAVDSLAAKLKTLADEKQILSTLRNKVGTFLNELEQSRMILKDGEKKARNDQLDPSFTEKLSFIYDTDDIFDKFIPEISRRRSGNLSAWKQLNFRREADKILSRCVVKHNPDADPLLRNDDSRNSSHFEESTSSEGANRWERIAALVEDSANIVGLEDQRKDLSELILEKRRSSLVIAVVGEAGSGKTTLVKFIFDSIEIKKEFECCAWITVSDKSDAQDLLISILRQVSVVREGQKLQLKELQDRLRNYLKPRTFLIVLDDVQSDVVWHKLKAAFPSTVHTSRVILTLRDIEVARKLGSHSQLSADSQMQQLNVVSQIQLFQIRRLNPKETRDLFKKKVLQAADKTNNSWEEKLEAEVVSKCDGLPLAIVTLAGLLSAKPVNDWYEWMKDNVKEKLSKQEEILFLSYQELPSSLRPFLLYLGIFPKSHEIPIRRLFRLWLAEGLAIQKAGGREAEDLLEKNFEQLVQRNLIVVAKRRFGSPKTCMPQPALYDSIFRAAAKTGFFHVQRNYHGEPEFNIVRRLVVQHSDTSTNPKDYDRYHKHLRSYISFDNHKGDTPANEVDKLLKRITYARSYALLMVLDLERVYKPVLSETLGKLQRLKYLGLRWTFLDSIPESIGKLPCLETLDVKHTNIPFLPDSIWKAEGLCHLYMNEIHFQISNKKRNIISFPSSKLQTLWGLLVGKNYSDMLIWLQTLTDLRKLGLTCLDASVEDITGWICKLENLQSLRLRSINKFNEPSNLILPTFEKQTKLHELHLFGILNHDKFEGLALLKNLRVLTLSVSQREEDPMPDLGGLPHLNILRLFARSYIGSKMNSIRGGFPKLRVLKLWVLEKLEEWIVEEGSMLQLRELEIRCCENLEWPAGLQHLANSLKVLNLTNMPDKFVEDARANMTENVLLEINTKKLEIPPLPH